MEIFFSSRAGGLGLSSALCVRRDVELVVDDEGAVEEAEYQKEGDDHGGEQAEYEEAT